jgi:hypothetical protein
MFHTMKRTESATVTEATVWASNELGGCTKPFAVVMEKESLAAQGILIGKSDSCDYLW